MTKHYFLVGIGGISMSGIAKLLFLEGNEVSGSDIKKNDETSLLEEMGIKVIIGQSEKNITNEIDELIYTSPAINPGSPGKVEIDRANELKIPIYKRSEFIGKLMKDKIGISVAGMHGKTTITAMLGFVLKKLGQSPIVLVGGEFNGFNYQNLEYPSIGYKNSKYFISEACEYDRSFLNFKTQIGIISNIEEEHLDYFKRGLLEILETFKKFVSQIPKTGFVVLNKDDKNIERIKNSVKCEIIEYLVRDLDNLKIKLNIPGIHNQMNALAVVKLTEKLGFNKDEVIKILENFTGVARRFEQIGKVDKTIFIDDYAHHPTEIKSTLKALKEFYKDKKVLTIFQPHQYARTKLLFDDFVKVFSENEFLGITDVFQPAGRGIDKSVGSKQLVEKILLNNKNAIYLPEFNDVYNYIKNNFSKFDVIVTMGAGPINTIAKKFIKDKNGN